MICSGNSSEHAYAVRSEHFQKPSGWKKPVCSEKSRQRPELLFYPVSGLQSLRYHRHGCRHKSFHLSVQAVSHHSLSVKLTRPLVGYYTPVVQLMPGTFVAGCCSYLDQATISHRHCRDKESTATTPPNCMVIFSIRRISHSFWRPPDFFFLKSCGITPLDGIESPLS